MKNPQDRFSRQTAYYKKYRPEYPAEFINDIISLVRKKNSAWDCGTGNGQVAGKLSPYFHKVVATDISETQISKATEMPNINYYVARAEETEFADNSFDLITVAQAVHWFDFEHFNREAIRVSVNGGILALWGYGLLRFGDNVDSLIDIFYSQNLQKFWDKERRHVEQAYARVPFPFEEIQLPGTYEIQKQFNLSDLLGYFRSWSAVQNFEKANGLDPVLDLAKKLKTVWGDEKQLRIASFPIFYKIGRVIK